LKKPYLKNLEDVFPNEPEREGDKGHEKEIGKQTKSWGTR
jgi:hypothetical protein